MSVRKRDRRGWVVLYDRQGFLPGMGIGGMEVAGIIAVSGSRKSGKTTTGTAVASALGWRRTGFGDYVRAEAIRRGANTDRPTLRELGATLLRELGPQQFTRRTLAAAGWRAGEALVIDGLRHIEVLEALREVVSPLPVMLVFIEAADDVRAERLAAADATVSEALAVGDRHSTEVQVETLVRARADVVVSGAGSLEASVSVVLEAARSKLPGL